MSDLPQPIRLLVDCPDRPGLIHHITGVLWRRGANIVSNHEFVDPTTGHFFMRTEFVTREPLDDIATELRAVLPPEANVRVGRRRACRMVVMATREPHCLGELLLLHANGELGASIAAVVSNHAVLEPLVERFRIPFHCVPHDGLERHEHEAAILEVLTRYEPDYVVLAKYMRILRPAFVQRYCGRIINIHHSFLPAFTGPNPYRQAFERGVKIIGATAHFVTEHLDEGPIIAQSVVAVDHSYRTSELTQAGRDVEKSVLAKALRLVIEERVFVSGNRTVVFE